MDLIRRMRNLFIYEKVDGIGGKGGKRKKSNFCCVYLVSKYNKERTVTPICLQGKMAMAHSHIENSIGTQRC